EPHGDGKGSRAAVRHTPRELEKRYPGGQREREEPGLELPSLAPRGRGGGGGSSEHALLQRGAGVHEAPSRGPRAAYVTGTLRALRGPGRRAPRAAPRRRGARAAVRPWTSCRGPRPP